MSSSTSAAPSLDPSDAVTLERWVIEELVEGSLYGIEVIFAFAVFVLLLRKGLSNSRARSLLFAATIILLGGSTISVVSRVLYYVHNIRQLGDPTYDPFETMTRWNTAQVVVTRINYLLGDLIVVWRAWILFDTWLVKVLLSGCIFISLGGTIVNLYFTIGNVETLGFSDIRFLFPATLLLTNITATALIAYKTWQYRHFIKRHLGKLTKPTQVEQILVLLVESGMIYAALWITDVILVARLSASNPASEYISLLFPHLETIYPATIILLTTLQKTHCDTTLQGQGQGSRGPMYSQSTIRFASAPRAPPSANGGTGSTNNDNNTRFSQSVQFGQSVGGGGRGGGGLLTTEPAPYPYQDFEQIQIQPLDFGTGLASEIGKSESLGHEGEVNTPGSIMEKNQEEYDFRMV